jgi:predicted ATP-dependent Lon-type protease
MGNGQDLEKFIEEAMNNIRDDRAITKSLLTDLLVFIKESNRHHKEVGHVAAKYVETLQRSNEQLVKLAALKQKKGNPDEDLSVKDKEEIFDLIKSSEEQGN